MKKIIGVLGIVIFAVALFFNTNLLNNRDVGLGSLLSINSANAEYGDGQGEWTQTRCECRVSGSFLGYSNDCAPGTSDCNDNDCSRFDVDDC